MRAFRSNILLYLFLTWSSFTQAVLPAHDHKRHRNNNLGLNSHNLHRHGIAIGFLPAWGEVISPNLPSDINAKLPSPMAIMGDYINLVASDPHMSNIDYHFEHWKKLEGKPVWELALLPSEGLESVTQEVANRIASKMKWLNSQGVHVWLRFAHEMNGDWYKWGMKPELFLDKWKMLFHAVKSQTKNTLMLWAPNSIFSDIDDVRGGYSKYWPGKEFVDIVGLSFYHYGGSGRLNILPKSGEALEKIKQFSDLYSIPHNLPVVLAETGASYTKSLQTGKPASGEATEHDIKCKWIQQILAPKNRRVAPHFKAITWFEVKKNENASGHSAVKSEDFRLLMGDEGTSKSALAYISS